MESAHQSHPPIQEVYLHSMAEESQEVEILGRGAEKLLSNGRTGVSYKLGVVGSRERMEGVTQKAYGRHPRLQRGQCDAKNL